MRKKDPTRTCFVLMPFIVKENDLTRYPDPMHWQEVYEGLIVPAVQNVELHCDRDDQDIGSRFIGENILRKIEQADLVLCDLSSQNPNVFLELGWALRADKPFVLIKDDLTSYAFDLNQQYTFDYSHALQPRVLSKEIQLLADVVRDTLNDPEHRFSIVKRMAVSLSAIKAIQEGDVQAKILSDIQQRLISMQRTSRPANLQPEHFPWPHLLRRGMTALFAVKEVVENPSVLQNPDKVVSVVDATVVRLGIRNSRDIQVSILDEKRRIIYHDWPELMGDPAYYLGVEGVNIYDDVFNYPSGVVAWIDRTSNVASGIHTLDFRANIALFSSIEEAGWKLVVETHHEITQDIRTSGARF